MDEFLEAGFLASAHVNHRGLCVALARWAPSPSAWTRVLVVQGGLREP